jgi:hypothetical protein
MMMMERLSTVFFLSLATLGVAGLSAQNLIQASGADGVVRLLPGDASVLESRDVRKDLSCTVTPVKPALAFDLRFRAGYEVGIPLNELAASEDLLTMVFRVTPDDRKDDPVYFFQRLRVPAIEENAKGSAYLNGAFELGEGRYHVDFLMRDRGERVCSSYWDVEARLTPRDKQLVLTLAPDSVAAVDRTTFKEEPPAENVADGTQCKGPHQLRSSELQLRNAATFR